MTYGRFSRTAGSLVGSAGLDDERRNKQNRKHIHRSSTFILWKGERRRRRRKRGVNGGPDGCWPRVLLASGRSCPMRARVEAEVSCGCHGTVSGSCGSCMSLSSKEGGET